MKGWIKKGNLLIVVVIFLFALMSYLSLTSINQLRGNARVVNYAGIVRGATQRLIKQELYGNPNDALILRLDSIIQDLIHGGGANELVALQDETFQQNMAQVQTSWAKIKEQIALVRQGGETDTLYEMSEAYFNLVDQTVFSAESYSEAQVAQSTRWLIGVNLVFVLLILVGVLAVVRSTALKQRAEALGKIAYLDILTQMPNRASCEREINNYTKNPPQEKLAVFMFDMNNLKRVNDLLGHQGGDRVIADFARIIKTEGEPFGFVGRYGGDEFVAIFHQCDEARAEEYLTLVNEKVIAYNLLHVYEVEKLSFAVGYVVETPTKMSVNDMIHEADKRMYSRKRQMKENKGE